MNQDSPHVNFESLVDHVVGELNDVASTRHIEECSECGIEARNLSRLVSTMKTDESENAPAYAIAALLRAYDERPRDAVVEPQPSFGQRIRAVLALDSLTLGPAMGFRSTAASEARQLIFTSGEINVDLRISKDGDTHTITGQSIGHLSGGEITIESGGIRLSTDIDRDGKFGFAKLSAGDYTLTFGTGDAVIEFPEFSIE